MRIIGRPYREPSLLSIYLTAALFCFDSIPVSHMERIACAMTESIWFDQFHASGTIRNAKHSLKVNGRSERDNAIDSSFILFHPLMHSSHEMSSHKQQLTYEQKKSRTHLVCHTNLYTEEHVHTVFFIVLRMTKTHEKKKTLSEQFRFSATIETFSVCDAINHSEKKSDNICVFIFVYQIFSILVSFTFVH